MRYLPNILTSSRLVAAPYILWLLWTREFSTALVWFALAGITDGLDGYFARRFNAGSRLGSILDPIADKVLLSGSFLVLGMNGAISWWLAGLVLGRDAVILLAAAVVLLLGGARREFPPTWAGKVSTCFQIGFILLLTAGFHQTWMDWAVVLVTGWSGVDYASRFLRR